MNFDSLVGLVGEMSFFDLALLTQAFDEQRESLRVQLSRWMKQGKVIGLRRSVYTLAEAYRRAPLSAPRLANELYRPSYLSGLWALAHHDLIPEAVVWLTSVTTRPPSRCDNVFGVFDYRHLKREAFFGYRAVTWSGQEILVAEPEKALLDHWHLSPGEWTLERLAEMRYQHLDQLTPAKLEAYAERFRRPRLRRAVERLLLWASCAEQGEVAL